MALVRFVADYIPGGRCAEPPVICVEVGTQVDLLAYNEELVDDLHSRLLQPELVALAGLFGRFPGVRARKTDRQGGHPDGAGEERELGYVGAPDAHVHNVKRRGSQRC